ncbi:hypothetical protein GN958_ATG07704 [Phytophthora infestans]|uniref:Uncharacterized protein n=1 Tax=Phytophthora infestans TaxID=4787 RepID=A0A8S9UQF5_PHYIN|nr:hypothetical protein GN958_ATG07704 [Phytophthora infestans]
MQMQSILQENREPRGSVDRLHGTVSQLLQTFNNRHHRLNKLEQQFQRQHTSERPQTSSSSRQKTKVQVQ